MKDITQGTLIYGMRSAKYPGTVTFGVIISAACDLAQDKIDKVFHLTAVPLKKWLCSEKGFQLLTMSSVSNCKDRLSNYLDKYDLSWEVVKTLSQDEFSQVTSQCIDNRKDTFAVTTFLCHLWHLLCQRNTIPHLRSNS